MGVGIHYIVMWLVVLLLSAGSDGQCSDNSQLHDMIKELSTALNTEESRSRALRDACTSEVELLTEELNREKENAATLKKLLNNIAAELDRTKANAFTLSQEMAAKDSLISDLKAREAAEQQIVMDALERKQALSRELEDVRIAHNTTQRNLNQCKDVLTALGESQTQINTLKRKLDEYQTGQSEKIQKYESLESRHTALVNKHLESSKELEELKLISSRLQEQTMQQIEQIFQQQDTITNLEKVLKDQTRLRERLTTLQDQNESLIENLESERLEKNMLLELLQSNTSPSVRVEKSCTDAEDALKELNRKLQNCEEQLSVAKDEL
eukprot:c7609_g2_i1.p1 GENE.c7609_g2_i1~~c7609_g2_i1.p1  ORF type:complete len:326 (-),score=81.37 c7609_g2_i1:61-1038(-)